MLKKAQIKNIVASFRRTAKDFPAFFRAIGRISDTLLRVPVPPSPQTWLELGRVSHVVDSLAARLDASLTTARATPPQEATSHEPIDLAFLEADLTTIHAMIASAAANLMRITFLPYGDGVVVCTHEDVARLDSFRVLILTTRTIADQVFDDAKAALAELQRQRDERQRDLN